MTEQEQKELLRCAYAKTLKEIVRHESAIKRLKEEAKELEDKLIALDNLEEPIPHLDRDGCVYWDSLLVKNEEENNNDF